MMSATLTARAPDRGHQLTQDHLRQIIEMQSHIASADFDLAAFMQTVVERLQAFTYATGAVVELVEGDDMVYSATSGSVAAFVGMRLPISDSLSGLCLRTREVTLAEDTSTDPRVNAVACKKVGAASMVVVPLLRKNAVVGVLKVLSNETHAFGSHDVYTLNLLAGVLGAALGQQLEMVEQKQLGEHLRHMAQNDSLTGLPNRALFNDRLAHAVTRNSRGGKLLALMYMDIDRFKHVNDTYGHGVGDALLKEFARRVRKVVRASDTVARLGGDEFTLIAENLRSRKEAEQIAMKIVQAVRPEFLLEGHTIQISTSIGIMLAFGQDMATDAFIRKADEALYEAKKAGRDTFRFAKDLPENL
jgi:diguanylate cyclase (GGDEF)-like protein